MKLVRDEDAFMIDTSLLGLLLDMPPSEVHDLMRRSEFAGFVRAAA